MTMLGRNKSIGFAVYQENRAFYTFHHLQVVEVLLNEHAEKLAGHVRCHFLDCRVGTHEYQAARLE